MKISFNIDDSNTEIKLIIAARKYQKLHTLVSDSGPIPGIISSGLFEYPFNGGNLRKVSFFIMKKFNLNLE